MQRKESRRFGYPPLECPEFTGTANELPMVTTNSRKDPECHDSRMMNLQTPGPTTSLMLPRTVFASAVRITSRAEHWTLACTLLGDWGVVWDSNGTIIPKPL